MKAKTKTIAVSFSKGGIGKTTSVINLGFGLVQQGYKVLMVDLDYNSYLTQYFVGNDYDTNKTIYQIMKGNCLVKEAIIPIKFGNRKAVHYDSSSAVYDLIPCSKEFSNISADITQRTRRTEFMLKDSLDSFLSDCQYDFVLFDCPPSEASLKINVFAMVDYALLVCNPTVAALNGYSIAVSEINTAIKYDNPNLKVLGIAACDTNNTSEHLWGIEMIQDQEDFYAFKTKIRHCSAIGLAYAKQCPVQYCRSTSNAAIDYTSLTNEVIERINKLN